MYDYSVEQIVCKHVIIIFTQLIKKGKKWAFSLCPRINAAGRMDIADYAVMLMLSENEEEAAELSQKLNEFNQRRKDDERQIIDDIAKRLKENSSLFDDRIVVIWDEYWNTGVVA